MKKKILNLLINKEITFGIIMGIIFFLFGGLFAVKRVPTLSVIFFSVLTGGFAFLLTIILTTILKNRHLMIKRLHETQNELQATIGLNKLTKLPLDLGGWAITAQFLENLVKEIYLREPNIILECGSGTSTVVIAACLKDLGKGKVISLDHKNYFANKTRRFLTKEQLTEYAEVVTAPLKEYSIRGKEWNWYEADFESLLQDSIDILVVDGPPGDIQPLSRYPAVPFLKEFLSDEYIILLDDGNRPDEKEIAQKWASMLGADLEFNNKYLGYWIIEKKV